MNEPLIMVPEGIKMSFKALGTLKLICAGLQANSLKSGMILKL